MARLEVSAEEAAAWSPRINAIVEWCARLQRAVRLASRSFPPLRFGKLRDVDVSAAGPVVRAGEADASEAELSQRLRADVVVDFPQRDEMLAAAATLESPFIRIPKIME
jgi:Asp-tRNA(Asn)/Glu-tRNA(Gln) amidotransferase C subunit